MIATRDRARPVPRAALLLAFVCSVACGKQPPQATPQPPPVAGLPALQRSIDGLLANPDLARGTWGVAVRSLSRNELLYTSNAHRLLIPASTAKVVTLAIAAERLGWEFRFPTRIMARGPVTDGVLDGDLIVIGSGDPTFDDWDGTGSRRFFEWAEALKARGITAVRGGIIGDDNVFDDDGLGSGWAWDDVAASYSGATSGLQFNQDTAQLVISAGQSAGSPPHLEVRPGFVTLQVRNLATTAAAGPPLTVRPLPRSTAIELTGSIAPGAEPIVRNVSVPNPTLYFVTAARDALIKAGVTVAGDAIDVDDLPVAVPPTDVMLIAESWSPTLAELSRTMMLLSQNLYAETLLKTIAARSGAVGTTAGGVELLMQALGTLGVSSDEVALVDGSGLSRYNLITPDALARILAYVHASDQLRDPFMAALPLAGVDGTLSGRMKGTAAERKTQAKTGSLTNARTLAGFVTSADGEPLAFAVMANHFNVDNEIVDRTSDAIVAALAAFSRR